MKRLGQASTQESTELTVCFSLGVVQVVQTVAEVWTVQPAIAVTHILEESPVIPVKMKGDLQTVHLSAAAAVQPSQLTEQSVQAPPGTENFAAPQEAQACPAVDPELAAQGVQACPAVDAELAAQGAQADPEADPELAAQEAQACPAVDPELAAQSVHWVTAEAAVPANCLFAGQFVQTVGDAVVAVPAAW